MVGQNKLVFSLHISAEMLLSLSISRKSVLSKAYLIVIRIHFYCIPYRDHLISEPYSHWVTLVFLKFDLHGKLWFHNHGQPAKIGFPELKVGVMSSKAHQHAKSVFWLFILGFPLIGSERPCNLSI